MRSLGHIGMAGRSKTRQLTKNDFRLFPEEYWKYQDSPDKKPETEYDPIYRAVGMALSYWEGVEEALTYLFLNLCNETNLSSPVAKTYGSIESSGARLKTLMDAAERFFGKDWLRQPIKWRFEHLRSSVESASRLRNEIAHGLADRTVVVDLRSGTPIHLAGIFLRAPHYMTARNRGPNEDPFAHSGSWASPSIYRYNSENIIELAGKFRELHFKLNEIMAFDLARGADGKPKMLRDLIEAPEAGRDDLEPS